MPSLAMSSPPRDRLETDRGMRAMHGGAPPHHAWHAWWGHHAVRRTAPISLLSADVRLSPPVSWGRLSRLRRPLLSRSFCASWSSPLLCSMLLLVSHGRSQFSKVCLSSACVQGGGQNARLFAIGTRLEVDLVGAFWSTLTTVLGKASKRTFQKWSKGGRAVAAVAAVAISIGGL